MLKWLRKYNSFILVVGGVLLMVAWLLPETITQLGRTPLGSAPMRISGSRVSYDRYEFARREYYALNTILPGGPGQNADHWVLLTHEAAKLGLLAGKHDGPEFLQQAARDIVTFQLQRQNPFSRPDPAQIDQFAAQYASDLMNKGVPRAMSEARLTEDEVLRSLGKLHGVLRMRALFTNAPRFSDRRLITEMKSTDDAATVDYVFIGPEKELASVPDPDPAALDAHFEKYKTVKPGEGEFGVGYLLPDRVKLAWLYVDQNAVQQAITPDPVEVRKRFVKAYPTGQPPAGTTEQAAMANFENAVRVEQTEKIMRAIDVAIKGEFEKATRKLDTDGEYKKLPEDWKPVDFEKLRDTVVQRVKEATGTTIPAPTVQIQGATWLTQEEVAKLPGIGGTFLRRGNNMEMFPNLVFKVRELAGNNETLLQAGVPSMDAISAVDGGKYYFEVLAAKKESAPDSADEIREKVVNDYKRIAAFEKLKARQESFQQVAASTGLETLAKSTTPDGKGDLEIKRNARVDGYSVGNGDQIVNDEAFRKAVLEVAAKIDPLSDVSKLNLADRTVVAALPKSQGVVVATITAVSPLTLERFRANEQQTARMLLNKENSSLADDPYSLPRLEERLKVEYMDGRKDEGEKKDQPKPKGQAS